MIEIDSNAKNSFVLRMDDEDTGNHSIVKIKVLSDDNPIELYKEFHRRFDDLLRNLGVFKFKAREEEREKDDTVVV